MGCITSHRDWPTEPPVRYVYRLVLVDGAWVKKLVPVRSTHDRRKKAGR